MTKRMKSRRSGAPDLFEKKRAPKFADRGRAALSKAVSSLADGDEERGKRYAALLGCSWGFVLFMALSELGII